MACTDHETSNSLNIPRACFFELCLYIPYNMQRSYILGASLLLFNLICLWCKKDHTYLLEVNLLLKLVFLFTSNASLSNETAHQSSHVDSKSNSFTKAVTCCHIILYWKMNTLVWGTSFYWANRAHDGRYGWEKCFPNR